MKNIKAIVLGLLVCISIPSFSHADELRCGIATYTKEIESVETKQIVSFTDTLQIRSSAALSIVMQEFYNKKLAERNGAFEGKEYNNCMVVGEKVLSYKPSKSLLNCSQLPNGVSCDPTYTLQLNYLCDVTYYKETESREKLAAMNCARWSECTKVVQDQDFLEAIYGGIDALCK